MIKRFLAYALTALVLLLPVQVEAKGKILNPDVAYKGTASSLRISSVDGTAFIDNLPAGVTSAYMDGKHYLRVYDPAGKYIEGVLKSVGSAETLSATEKITNGDFTSGDTGWGKETGWTIVDQGGGDYEAVATNAANTYTIYQMLSGLSANALYKYVTSCTSRTQGDMQTSVSSPTVLSNSIVSPTGSGTMTLYHTPNNDSPYIYIRSASAGATLIGRADDASYKQVLTPSSSGSTIVNAISGSQYNWTTKEAGFDYNNAGTYTFQVWSEN